MKTYVKVKESVNGIHCYKDASGDHDYIKNPHRHEFQITAKVQVYHNDREIEFFALADKIRNYINDNYMQKSSMLYDFKGLSCEAIAERLTEYLDLQYTEHLNRKIVVTVSEDGQNEAEVEND